MGEKEILERAKVRYYYEEVKKIVPTPIYEGFSMEKVSPENSGASCLIDWEWLDDPFGNEVN